MREYSSIGIGTNYYLYLFFALGFVLIIIQKSNVIPYYYDGNVFSFLIDRDPWTTGVLTLLFLSFGINNVIVDRHGITRKVLLLPFLKEKSRGKKLNTMRLLTRFIKDSTLKLKNQYGLLITTKTPFN